MDNFNARYEKELAYQEITSNKYTLYGIPSVYYGSEFAIEGKKENGSDWNLRPCLELDDFKDAYENNEITALCAKYYNRPMCRDMFPPRERHVPNTTERGSHYD